MSDPFLVMVMRSLRTIDSDITVGLYFFIYMGYGYNH